MILCEDEGGTVSKYAVGQDICSKPVGAVWPELPADWSMVSTSNTLIVAQCTEGKCLSGKTVKVECTPSGCQDVTQ